MLFFHLSDLHLGQTLCGYSLREDQEDILKQIVHQAALRRPDAILIAGDVYDKSVPSSEAVALLDNFLTQLDQLSLPILLISGNHDSPQRLDFASQILQRHGVHIGGLPPRTSRDHLKKVVLSDAFGDVCFYLLPFVKPGWVRHLAEEREITTYTDAVQFLLSRETIDPNCRNVILSHQFYASAGSSPSTCDSERPCIGGLDQVDVSSLWAFDYAALGHLHSPQSVGRASIRYCGTPLKYSISEANQTKSISAVTLDGNGFLGVEEIPLTPLRDVKVIRGTLEEVMRRGAPDGVDDYVSITLTDEEELWHPKDQLERLFPRILEIRLDNERTRQRLDTPSNASPGASPMEIFSFFFEELQKRPLSDEESAYLSRLMEEVNDAMYEEKE